MDPTMRSSPTKSTYNRRERKSMTIRQSSSAITSQSTPPSSSYYSPTEERDKVIIQSPICNEGHMVIYEPSPYEPSVLTTPEEIIDDGSKLVQFNNQNTKEIRKDGFDHCYVKVPVKDRLAVLFATLRRSTERKVIIIFSTWQSCKFHAIIFKQLEMCKVYELHEKTEDVKNAYKDFLYHYPGVLFTSAVSMSQFDIPPNTDYVIQYEPLINPVAEYIYRLSNTKLYHTSSHKALLFITPDEVNILKYFNKKINTEELEGRKSQQFQTQIEKLVNKHVELNGYSRKALKAFLEAYKDSPHKDIYDHTKLDTDALRQSFGQQSNNTESQETENETEKKETKKKWRERNSVKPPMDVGGVTQLNVSGLTLIQQKQTTQKAWTTKQRSFRSKESKKPWIEREQKTWRHSHKAVRSSGLGGKVR